MIPRHALLVLFALAPVFAQAPTFSTDVKVVNLFATVRDKDNHLIKNLSKDDFQLQEDEWPQTILYFSQETGLPLTIGLLVDTSRSQRGVLEKERTASYEFLERMLRPDKDRAFVMSFDIRVNMLSPLISSPSQLRETLDSLKIPPLAGTKLYNAIKRASEQTMLQQKGRKAFIILSDGVDAGSRTTLVSAIEYAQRADTTIFSILFAYRSLIVRPSQRGIQTLRRLASETGGGYFEVTQSQPIEKIYERIEEELRTQYSLGYTSDRADAKAGYRKIKLTTKRTGLVVQTRDGYYPAK